MSRLIQFYSLLLERKSTLTAPVLDDSKPRKRGRPTKKSTDITDNGRAASGTPKGTTPQPKAESVPQGSPTGASPAKETPTSSNKVQKALPTQRDHTTDQLNPEGDEYIVRDTDDAGEQKATPTGHLRGGREYRCRTFYVPNRGEKLFMLATECARVLMYRDSYLLFNKNRSLHKIIANQVEKDHLINEGILPYSYRSRQIAMVTARSMFRQFGARMIQNGRRVRDDYWEYKARKQGFTEDDLASDKRPATNKPKENMAEAASTNTNAMSILAGNQFQYVENPLQDPSLLPGVGLGVGNIVPNNVNSFYPMMTTDDFSLRDYGNVRRPRQDITGTPYQDRSQSSSTAEIVNQAAQAAEFNKQMRAQSVVRGQVISTDWNREHHSETPELLQTLPPDDTVSLPASAPQHASPQQSMRQHPSIAQSSRQSSLVPPQHRRSSSQMNNPSAYQPQHPGFPGQGMPSPAHMNASMQSQMPGIGQQQRASFAYGNPASAVATNPGIYNYLQQQQQAQQQTANMWQQSQQGANSTPNPQSSSQSPMHAGHAQLPQQYNQMSPHMARSPQQQMHGGGGMSGGAGATTAAGMPGAGGGGMQGGLHGMQGSGQMPNSSMSMATGAGMGNLGFQAMGAGAMPANPYAAMGRGGGMYPQGGAGSPQQFMGGQGAGAGGMSMYGGGGMSHMQAGIDGQGGTGQWSSF